MLGCLHIFASWQTISREMPDNAPDAALFSVQARILVVDVPRPIIPGTSAVLHMHARAVPCRISLLEALLDLKTGAIKKRGPAFRVLLKDQAALVELTLDEELCVECAEGHSCLSRLVLRIGGGMVALGTALAVLDDDRSSQ